MPARTLTLKRVRRYKNGDQKDVPLGTFGGEDLLHLFRAWALAVPKERLKDQKRRHYIRVANVTEGGRWVLVEAESGYWGEGGNTFDVVTDEVVHERSPDHAPADRTRLMFVLPTNSTSGFFLVEKSGANGAGTRLVEEFKVDLTGAFSKEDWIFETVQESSAWTKGAQLLSVTAVAHGFSVDIGDGSTTMEGRLSQILVPERGMGRYLPFALLKKLRSGKVKASEFIAFPDGVEINDTVIEVEKNGQSKKYSLGADAVPSLRVHLNEANENSLTPTEFKAKCLNEVRDLRAMEGEPWEEEWRTGKWTPSALAVTFPAAGAS